MIALIRKDNPIFEATLDDAGVWTCENLSVAAALNALADSADRSPAAGLPLREHVRHVADKMGCEITWGDVPDQESGMVY